MQISFRSSVFFFTSGFSVDFITQVVYRVIGLYVPWDYIIGVVAPSFLLVLSTGAIKAYDRIFFSLVTIIVTIALGTAFKVFGLTPIGALLYGFLFVLQGGLGFFSYSTFGLAMKVNSQAVTLFMIGEAYGNLGFDLIQFAALELGGPQVIHERAYTIPMGCWVIAMCLLIGYMYHKFTVEEDDLTDGDDEHEGVEIPDRPTPHFGGEADNTKLLNNSAESAAALEESLIKEKVDEEEYLEDEEKLAESSEVKPAEVPDPEAPKEETKENPNTEEHAKPKAPRKKSGQHKSNRLQAPQVYDPLDRASVADRPVDLPMLYGSLAEQYWDILSRCGTYLILAYILSVQMNRIKQVSSTKYGGLAEVSVVSINAACSFIGIFFAYTRRQSRTTNVVMILFNLLFFYGILVWLHNYEDVPWYNYVGNVVASITLGYVQLWLTWEIQKRCSVGQAEKAAFITRMVLQVGWFLGNPPKPSLPQA
jgi:outer membrane biosynthesis protein TonB